MGELRQPRHLRHDALQHQRHVGGYEYSCEGGMEQRRVKRFMDGQGLRVQQGRVLPPALLVRDSEDLHDPVPCRRQDWRSNRRQKPNRLHHVSLQRQQLGLLQLRPSQQWLQLRRRQRQPHILSRFRFNRKAPGRAGILRHPVLVHDGHQQRQRRRALFRHGSAVGRRLQRHLLRPRLRFLQVRLGLDI